MNTPQTAQVDGQTISIRDMQEAVHLVERSLEDGRGLTVFTLNLDHLVKRRRSKAFRDAYARATYVSADGWPVVALAKRSAPGIRLTTGADMVVPLCRMAARRTLPIYLFGSSDPILAQSAITLRRLCPGLDVRGAHAPPFGFDPTSEDGAAAAARIVASGARVCFVALGAPKQELFADAARADCPGTAFICIGAALDFIAGAKRRAPRLVQSLRLEWAWRLVREPRRLGLRYLRCGLLFLELAVPFRRSISSGPTA